MGFCRNTMLKFPPLKPHKPIGNAFVYSQKNSFGSIVYKMANKDGKYVGLMETLPTIVNNKQQSYSPNATSYPSLLIQKLSVGPKRQRFGSAFINIAKKDSFKHFCNGNIHLVASDMYDGLHPPQVFYRKLGFQFNKSSGFTERKVDEFIAGKIPESDLYGLGDTYMFFEHNVDKDGKMVESMKKFKEKFPEIFEWF